MSLFDNDEYYVEIEQYSRFCWHVALHHGMTVEEPGYMAFTEKGARRKARRRLLKAARERQYEQNNKTIYSNDLEIKNKNLTKEDFEWIDNQLRLLKNEE